VSDRFAMTTGTSEIGGVEERASRSLVPLVVPILVTAVVLSLVPIWLGESRVLMRVAVRGIAFASYAVGFNLIFGSTGQLFLCVGALAGVGGYGAALLADEAGWPLIPSILTAVVAASLLGGLLSYVAVRRSLGVIFTGIVTLIFSLTYMNLVHQIGGDSGFAIQSGSDTFLRSLTPSYYLMLGLVLVCLLVHGLLRRSHIGWGFRALRDDEVAAELAGVNVARYRVYAALIGAAMLGLAGALFAQTRGRVSPTTFGFAEVDVVVVVMLAFGGIGTLLGPVLGAVVFSFIEELLVDLGLLRHLAYGALIIALFLWLPRGVIPSMRNLFGRERPPEVPDESLSRPDTTPERTSSTAPD
jgi:branched-chain amino acid transport system permease protein